MESKTEKCGFQNSICSVDSQEIIKTVATRCHILRLKCSEIQNSAGSPPKTPLGELTALPRPLAGFKWPTSKGRERIEGDVREGTGGGGRGGEGTGGECCGVQTNP